MIRIASSCWCCACVWYVCVCNKYLVWVDQCRKNYFSGLSQRQKGDWLLYEERSPSPWCRKFKLQGIEMSKSGRDTLLKWQNLANFSIIHFFICFISKCFSFSIHDLHIVCKLNKLSDSFPFQMNVLLTTISNCLHE